MFQQGMGGGFNPMMGQNNMMNQSNTMNQSGMMNQNNMMNQSGMMNQGNMMNQSNMMVQNNMMNMMGQNGMMNQGMMNPMMNPNMNPVMVQQNQMMNQLIMQNQMQQNMWNQTMMQQQQQQNMMNQNFLQQQQNFKNNQPSTPIPNSINIKFRLQKRGQNDEEFTIQCTLEDKVSDVIKKFKIRANYLEDKEHEKFLFCAKILNETLTVAEARMRNNSVVFVINDRDIDGGNN